MQAEADDQTYSLKQTKGVNMKKANYKTDIRALIMMLFTWGVIECDFISLLIQNQILAFGIAPVIWGIGAFWILNKLKKQNEDNLLYANTAWNSRDWLILFFVISSSISIAVSNYLYVGIRPLLIREYFSGYLLYTIRNLLYYPLEVLLMLELLIYAQRTGEVLTKKSGVPWGALALFFLWGLPHFVHGFEDGMVSALKAFVYAIPFYASGKKIKTSYTSMLILWFFV